MKTQTTRRIWCVFVKHCERVNTIASDDDDGGDDRKELKFRLKTHTRHEIATTIIKHAQIHNSMPLPNVYMAAMSVSSSTVLYVILYVYIHIKCSL